MPSTNGTTATHSATPAAAAPPTIILPTTATSTIMQPMATPTSTRRRNLADYSIAKLAATNNDPVATILASLQEKKLEKECWVNDMLQARALIACSHPDDPKLPGYHREANEITYHVQVIT